jgi:endonuclease YncB( thermonuclease family)
MSTPLPKPPVSFVNKAVVTKVYDGDTIYVDLDKGHRVWLKDSSVRLLSVDSPERKSNFNSKTIDPNEAEFGEIVRNELLKLIPVGTVVVVQTFKSDDRERFLADVWRDHDGLHLNHYLLQKGLAVPYDGKSARPNTDWKPLLEAWKAKRT